jgi:hypothetical protein
MDKPTAEQFREMWSEALEDQRKPEIQMDVLNDVFEQAAAMFPEMVDKGLAEIYEELSGEQRDPFFDQYAQENPKIVAMRNRDVFNAVVLRDPADRNEDFIVGLTVGTIDPVIRIGLAINPQVADFSDIIIMGEPNITELPGYIKLHEAARDKNVGIAVVGLKRGEGREQQPLIIIDLSKDYNDGQNIVPTGLRYPVLSEPEEAPAKAKQQVQQPARRIKNYTIQ